MAHSVVIESVSHIGDSAIVAGTVDGAEYFATFWFSALTAFGNIALAQNYLAGLLVAQIPPAPVVLSTWNGTVNF